MKHKCLYQFSSDHLLKSQQLEKNNGKQKVKILNRMTL